MLSIEIINDTNKFYAMRDEWNAVLEQSGLKTPFLRHEWLSAWWKAYGSDKELFIIAFKDGDSYVGFAPLMKYRTRLTGIPIQAIGFFANHWVSFDFILLKGHEKLCVEKLVCCLLEQRKTIILANLSQQSTAAVSLQEELKKQKGNVRVHEKSALLVELKGTWQEYLQSRTKSFRDESGKKRRKLDKKGKLDLVRYSGTFDKETVLAELKAVSDASWQGKEKVAVLSTQQGMGFYRSIIEGCASRHCIDIAFLRLDNKPIAYQVCFHESGYFHAFDTAYDAAYHDFSPGLVIINMLLEQLFGHKEIKRFDFGFMTDYKNRWANGAESLLDCVVFPRSVFGLMIRCANFLKETRRKLKLCN